MSESERRPERSARDPKKRLGRELGRGSDSDTESLRSSRRSNRPLQNNGDEPRSRIDRNDQGEIVEYRHDDGQSYKVGDATYIQTQRSDVPYVISKISEIKVTKSGKAEFVCRPFHRPDDLPDQIYQKLTLDREKEFDSNSQMMEKIKDKPFAKRELFICDAEDVQRDHIRRNQIRGLCTIHYYKSLDEVVQKFQVADDSFFCILGYNPQKRVIACLDKEFERVKQMHQWTAAERGMFNAAENNMIPEAVPYHPADNEDSDEETPYETLTWRPNVADSDLVMYLRAARSMAAFAGMCDGGAADACNTATRDATTLNAIDALQKSNGKVDIALEKLCQNPMPSIPQRMWTDEDIRAFIKGLSTYGKDFFYISKEYLPRKDTAELIEFYYLWKKTQEGLSVRNKYRRAPKKSMYNMKSQYPRERHVPNSSEFSDDDNNSIDSQIEDSHICRNCYTFKSNDWHHGGKENYMLCACCRTHYKKYGTQRIIEDRPDTPQELRRLRHQEPAQQNELDYSIAADEYSQPLPETELEPKVEPKLEIKTEPDDSGTKRKLSVPTDEMETKKQKQEIKTEIQKEEPKILPTEVKSEPVLPTIQHDTKSKVTTYSTNIATTTPFLPVPKSPTIPPTSASTTPLLHLPTHTEKPLIPPQPGETITYAGTSPRNIPVPRSSPQLPPRIDPPPKVALPPAPVVIPSEVKSILGQPRPGVDPAPRPDPDDDHPSGPFPVQEDNARTYRTLEKIQFKKAYFVRNWEYSDGNSCARTDLFYCLEDSAATQIVRRREGPSVHPLPARPPTGRPPIQDRVLNERPQSNGSSHGHPVHTPQHRPGHRPPSSNPIRGNHGTPQPTHYPRPTHIPRPPMSPGFPGDHSRTSLTPQGLPGGILHPAVSAPTLLHGGLSHGGLSQLEQQLIQNQLDQQRMLDPRLLGYQHLQPRLGVPPGGMLNHDLMAHETQRRIQEQLLPFTTGIPGMPQQGISPLDSMRSTGMIDSRMLSDNQAAYRLAQAQAQALAMIHSNAVQPGQDPRYDPRLYQRLHQPK